MSQLTRIANSWSKAEEMRRSRCRCTRLLRKMKSLAACIFQKFLDHKRLPLALWRSATMSQWFLTDLNHWGWIYCFQRSALVKTKLTCLKSSKNATKKKITTYLHHRKRQMNLEGSAVRTLTKLWTPQFSHQKLSQWQTRSLLKRKKRKRRKWPLHASQKWIDHLK